MIKALAYQRVCLCEWTINLKYLFCQIIGLKVVRRGKLEKFNSILVAELNLWLGLRHNNDCIIRILKVSL